MLDKTVHPWKVYHNDRYTGRSFSNAVLAAQTAIDIATHGKGNHDKAISNEPSLLHPAYGDYGPDECKALAAMLPDEGREPWILQDPVYVAWLGEQRLKKISATGQFLQ